MTRHKKAMTTICLLAARLRSQFFHSLRHLSSHANDRSTIHRFGMTSKVWSALRWATTTHTWAPSSDWTPSAKGLPVAMSS